MNIDIYNREIIRKTENFKLNKGNRNNRNNRNEISLLKKDITLFEDCLIKKEFLNKYDFSTIDQNSQENQKFLNISSLTKNNEFSKTSMKDIIHMGNIKKFTKSISTPDEKLKTSSIFSKMFLKQDFSEKTKSRDKFSELNSNNSTDNEYEDTYQNNHSEVSSSSTNFLKNDKFLHEKRQWIPEKSDKQYSLAYPNNYLQKSFNHDFPHEKSKINSEITINNTLITSKKSMNCAFLKVNDKLSIYVPKGNNKFSKLLNQSWKEKVGFFKFKNFIRFIILLRIKYSTGDERDENNNIKISLPNKLILSFITKQSQPYLKEMVSRINIMTPLPF